VTAFSLGREVFLVLLLAGLIASARAAIFDITISWQHSISYDANSAYIVKQSVNNGPFVPIATTTNNWVTVSNVFGQQMRFHVVLTNLWGQSVPSQELKFPPFPDAPSGVTATVIQR
jgi:hypothetical protein